MEHPTLPAVVDRSQPSRSIVGNDHTTAQPKLSGTNGGSDVIAAGTLIDAPGLVDHNSDDRAPVHL